jgi:hypothetical protein
VQVALSKVTSGAANLTVTVGNSTIRAAGLICGTAVTVQTFAAFTPSPTTGPVAPSASLFSPAAHEKGGWLLAVAGAVCAIVVVAAVAGGFEIRRRAGLRKTEAQHAAGTSEEKGWVQNPMSAALSPIWHDNPLHDAGVADEQTACDGTDES